MEKWERDYMKAWNNYAFEDYYEERKARERKRALYFLMQKLAGLLCLGISALDAILLQDLTVAVIFVPLGLYLILTREKVVK